ncbi:DUF4376 domain-containing protein [Burkholderia cenocepacia]|uniref:DUF4376 domain-containing protein n=1 Tax=Burkholderia cenocepacia TaxID=95486 RepID=UPI002652D295|nr:DUF4376 domain-containing protein [Burkholderia cenocepacia]MDN7540267.1 DUF4376 domain-containing protein [Burkholderia cenocepacia]
MTIEYYVFANAAGQITGSGSTADGTIPEGAIICTQSQAANPLAYAIAGGGVVEASDAQLLEQARAAQISIINAAYAAAVMEPVSFKTAEGTTESFQADPGSQLVLMQATQGYTLAGSVPAGFYWVAVNNTQVPFTLADLSALYQAMLDRGWAAFQHKQSLKAQIAAAATVAAVQAISW